MKKKFEYSNVILLSLAHMLHDIYTSFLAPILPLLIKKHNLTFFMASLLSIFQRFPSLANPFIGILAEKVSLRYFVIISPAIVSICMSLLGIAPSYIFLIIFLFVSGIAATLFHVPSPVLIKEFSHDKVGRGMSFYMLGGEFARTLGPLTILGAVSLWGLEGTFRLIPFGLAASFILYLKLRNIKIEKKYTTKKDSISISFKKLIPIFVIITGISFSRAFMKSALTLFLPTYFSELGESVWFGGTALSILQFAGALGTLFAGTYSDKIGRKASLVIISIANPILMGLFLISGKLFLYPLLILMGFFLFASGPVLLALVHDEETDNPAFVNSIYMTVVFFMGALASMSVGFISDKIGLYLTFKISAGIAFMAIPFAFNIKKKNK